MHQMSDSFCCGGSLQCVPVTAVSKEREKRKQAYFEHARAASRQISLSEIKGLPASVESQYV